MSIQPNRVVWRIVDEVARAPRPRLAFEQVANRSERVVLVRHRPAGRDAGLATLFHFWAHALRAFLELHDQADQLEGTAGYAMCERLGPRELEIELAQLYAPLEPAMQPALPDARDAYKMMDGPCRRSLVLEGTSERCALFGHHGAARAAASVGLNPEAPLGHADARVPGRGSTVTSRTARRATFALLLIALANAGCTDFKRWAYARGDREPLASQLDRLSSSSMVRSSRISDSRCGRTAAAPGTSPRPSARSVRVSSRTRAAMAS